MRDAYAHVTAFRERMNAAGISPAAIRGAADLAFLPPSGRGETAAVRPADLLRSGIRPAACRRAQTSGTTGDPLDIFMSPPEAFYRRILLLRAIRRNVRLPLPFTVVEVGAGAVRVSRLGSAQNLWLARVVRISRLLPIAEQAHRASRARAHVITGHPSCLGLLAEELVGQKTVVSPRLVVSRGEMLQAAMKQRLEEVFGCAVVDYYNCDEVGNVAWQCPHDARVLHVNTDACIVEVVDDAGSSVRGVPGRVVVTNLYNWTMPFIRYELGDRAVLLPESGSACRCGYRGPSLSSLEGREGDYLWTTDGRPISPRAMGSVMAVALLNEGGEGYAVRRFQVVQEEGGDFHVRLIPAEGAGPALTVRVADALRSFDPEIQVTVEFVERLDAEPSGKFRPFVSKHRPSDQGAGGSGRVRSAPVPIRSPKS